MDASVVFIDSKEGGTSCSICQVHLRDKTPSSKARHLKTKMHQTAVQLVLSEFSRTYVPLKNVHVEERNDHVVENGESSFFHDIIGLKE